MMTREDKKWLVGLAKQISVISSVTPDAWLSYQSSRLDEAFIRFLPKEPAKLKKEKLDEVEKSFMLGFGMGVGGGGGGPPQTSKAGGVIWSKRIPFEDLVAAGVDEFDLRCLRSEFKK
jgi:hypothetical protein